ncbi:hypothetical protein ST37_14210 [Vibrio sp. qd031]|uniref:TonB-dependent receptor plug domain-containing protein n=1 Tax=Vibrio sp. qd031 TaxID=1603038 RepID=UPI000A1195D2|nr:TonB-dependent receptor [Vibrio sp. qd031]ORT49540.1 hypothetical protein ST37_14210 [Vibrio sp. qd031]
MKTGIALWAGLIPFIALANDTSIQELDLDSLMDSDVQLSSVMKRLQSTKETGASVYVLSGNEIMQSGVSSIPQALTLVPGIQVRKIDNNAWAITARATAGRYSSKLLVMIDGRSVYDAVHVGVNWETLDLPLYDIEKIEVVRGQGGLLWGSNATNGVINIITKHSEDSRGLTAMGQVGTGSSYDASIRYGSEIGTAGAFRVFAFGDSSDGLSRTENNTAANDGTASNSIGGRLDLNLNESLFLQAQGRYLDADYDNTLEIPSTTYGKVYQAASDNRRSYAGNARLEHWLNEYSSQALQIAYFDLEVDTIYYKENQHQFDADYQINTQLSETKLDFGASYRYIGIDIENTDYVSTISDEDKLIVYGLFAQAQFDLLSDELRLVVGNKSEHNSFTGWEHQPMGRLIWTINDTSTAWASLSRGVRIPSYVEYNLSVKANGVAVSEFLQTGVSAIDDSYISSTVVGNDNIDAETSDSIEAGYRINLSGVSSDVSLFYTQARNVLAIEPELVLGASEADIQTAIFTNNFAALAQYLSASNYNWSMVSNAELVTYGGEWVIGWQALPNLKTEFGFSYTDYEYELADGTTTAIGFDTALQQFLTKAALSLHEDHSLFALLRYETGDAYKTDDYAALDLSWNWQVTPSLQVGLTGTNLFHDNELEYDNSREVFTVPSYIETSYSARLKLDF